VRSLS
jgi:hypothetical protein